MSDLAKQRCIPCEGGAKPLAEVVALDLLDKLNKEWKLEDGKLVHTFQFRDFKSALEFVNKVGAIAESEAHHPDIELSWGKVVVKLSTHSIGGLSQNDFILAAKIDEIK